MERCSSEQERLVIQGRIFLLKVRLLVIPLLDGKLPIHKVIHLRTWLDIGLGSREGGSGGGVVQVFALAGVGSFLGLGGRGWVVAKKVGGRSLGSLLLWVLVKGS